MLVHDATIKDEHIMLSLLKYPHAVSVTVSQEACNRVNRGALERLFTQLPTDVIKMVVPFLSYPVTKQCKSSSPKIVTKLMVSSMDKRQQL